jgi:diadenosine tetraphosphate (Ap4A) HIT family hydrolase
VADDELAPYLRRLPIGERLPLGELANDPLFPFDGEILVKPLEEPRIPEEPRLGEPGGGPCPNCGKLLERAIWQNERWLVRTLTDHPHGLPMVVLLIPRAHHDLEDLPAAELAELGPIIQRVARAVATLPGVARVHIGRHGDASEHLHLWFLTRPTGVRQMGGPVLDIWDELLPRVPPEEWRANLRAVAAALAEDDGEALV